MHEKSPSKVWGTGGREFKSPRSDQCFQRDSGVNEERMRPANVKRRPQKCKNSRRFAGCSDWRHEDGNPAFSCPARVPIFR